MWGYIVLAVIVLLIIVLVVKAALFTDKRPQEEKMPEEKVHAERAVQNLSKAIQIKTVSNLDESKTDWSKFEEFHEFLKKSYPLVHEKLKLEKVSKASLIYFWEGTDKDSDPIALLSHMDVVPVTEGTEKDWEHPAFSGEIADGHIWGRGAMDMKHHLIGVMESVETLLEEGYVPKRSVYICFGHNEEIVAAPEAGAREISNLLKSRGVHLESVLDEGGILLPVNTMGINAVFGTVGTTEKGAVNFKITVSDKGGHSSSPNVHSAVGKLAKIVTKIEKHQFKAKMLPVTRELIERAGRHMPFYIRLILGNIWFFKPLLMAVMKKVPPTASVIRTTIAVTQAQGSPAANVLPQKASVTVNCRILPGETIQSTLEHMRKVINDDSVTIEIINAKEPSVISPTDSRAYKTIDRLCRQNGENTVAIPLLVMGGTDSYHYEQICENVYRFSPFVAPASLLTCTHATNERLPVESMSGAITFFKRYIKEMTKD